MIGFIKNLLNYGKKPDFISPYQSITKEIDGLKTKDEIINVISKIDTAFKDGKISSDTVMELYSIADKKMKNITSSRKTENDIAPGIKQIEPQFEIWKSKIEKLEKYNSHVTDEKAKIEKTISEMVPISNILKIKTKKLNKYSKLVTPGHPQYQNLVKISNEHKDHINIFKKEISGLVQKKSEIDKQLIKIQQSKNEGKIIIEQYEKQANEKKGLLLNKSLYKWIMN